MKFNYKEKQYDIEFEGKKYSMAQRTKATMAAIKTLSGNDEMSEYENNMELLCILFGKDNAYNMFPDGEDTNLDKLAAFSNFVLELYMKEYKDIQAEKAAKALKPYTDTIKTLESVSNLEKNKK